MSAEITAPAKEKKERHLPFLQGILPIIPSHIPTEIIAKVVYRMSQGAIQ